MVQNRIAVLVIGQLAAGLLAVGLLVVGWPTEVRAELPGLAPAPVVRPAPDAAPDDQLEVARVRRRKPGRKKRRRSSRRRGGALTVPIDVGIGPIGIVPNPPALFDQPVHGGLALSLAAVVDQALIRRHKNQIPAQWRKQASQVDEIRIRPWYLALIPSVLIISPALLNTGMYGAIWHPFGIGLPLLKDPVKLKLGADLSFAYLFMHSRSLPEPTHFLRPGLGLNATLTVPVTEHLLFSAGWASDFFIPQPLGQPPWVFWPLDEALWHLGGPFLKIHLRFPYTVQM